MNTEPLQVKRSGDFYYPIYFEEGFEALADAIRTEGLDGRKMCIVSDTNVAPLYADSLKSALSSVASSISLFVFEAGEKSKHLRTVQDLYEKLIESELDRKSLIVALGGGVVGDLAGFILSQPCRWCSMVGLYYRISFIPIISPCIIIFDGVGHFCFVKQN